jgi:hypothetical protein
MEHLAGRTLAMSASSPGLLARFKGLDGSVIEIELRLEASPDRERGPWLGRNDSSYLLLNPEGKWLLNYIDLSELDRSWALPLTRTAKNREVTPREARDWLLENTYAIPAGLTNSELGTPSSGSIQTVAELQRKGFRKIAATGLEKAYHIGHSAPEKVAKIAKNRGHIEDFCMRQGMGKKRHLWVKYPLKVAGWGNCFAPIAA